MSNMQVDGNYADNGAVRIHYYDSGPQSEEGAGLPLVICPGLSEMAEEYLDLVEWSKPRRAIVLSFRGRGGSDTPAGGYDLEEHVSDLESVVKQAGVNKFHLMGYSRGVAYALAYALREPSRVQSLILCDYPPEHRSMPDNWPHDYIHAYLIPFGRSALIREAAVYGIQRDSRQVMLEGKLEMPVMVARGGLADSLLTETDMERYRAMCSRLTERVYAGAGHAIKSSDREELYRDIAAFIQA